jgi:lipopolysaccharide transport protein LptA
MMKSKKIFLCILFVSVCLGLVFSNDKKPKQKKKKVHIECLGGMRVDGTGNTAVFKKDVILKQGNLLLKCQLLEIVYSEINGKKDISVLKGYTDVYFDLPDHSLKGQCEVFIYEHKTGRLELKSKNKITINQGNQSISGEHVIVNVNTGDAYAHGKVVLSIETD